MLRLLLVSLSSAALLAANGWQPWSIRQADGEPVSRLSADVPVRHRPVALAFAPGDNRLLVANRASGSISIVDLEQWQTAETWRVGREITDLAHWRDQQFLAVDFRQHTLSCIDLSGDQPRIAWSVGVCKYPIRLSVGRDRQSVYVAGLWSRQLTRVELPRSQSVTAAVGNTVNLPFAPGHLCHALQADGVFAIDAFGDQYAVVDAAATQIIASGHFSSRRVGGVAVLPKTNEIVVTQQLLNRLARATRNDVHWGLTVANEIRRVTPGRLTQQPFQPLAEIPSIPVGGTGDAKGDPGAIAISQSGMLAIAIGGVDQVALGGLDRRGFSFVDVGRRPVALQFSGDGRRLLVANYFDDTISAIDVDRREVIATMALGRTPRPTVMDKGERLFFNARLSHDGWMSCHSCHVEGHTSGFLNDNLSDQSFGAPKRVLSLLGHGDTAPFAWNGSAATLAEQIRNSIEDTMQSDLPAKENQIEAIAAFVKSLPPPPSIREARDLAFTRQMDVGESLFTELECRSCHSGPSMTSEQTFDVGLVDELGQRRFNPPSLVGVSQRDRLLHDGRAAGLAELFTRFRHGLTRELSDDETQALVDFLNGL